MGGAMSSSTAWDLLLIPSRLGPLWFFGVAIILVVISAVLVIVTKSGRVWRTCLLSSLFLGAGSFAWATWPKAANYLSRGLRDHALEDRLTIELAFGLFATMLLVTGFMALDRFALEQRRGVRRGEIEGADDD